MILPAVHACNNHRKFKVDQMVVVAFSSRARILGECSTIHSPPALFFFQRSNEAKLMSLHSLEVNVYDALVSKK